MEWCGFNGDPWALALGLCAMIAWVKEVQRAWLAKFIFAFRCQFYFLLSIVSGKRETESYVLWYLWVTPWSSCNLRGGQSTLLHFQWAQRYLSSFSASCPEIFLSSLNCRTWWGLGGGEGGFLVGPSVIFANGIWGTRSTKIASKCFQK